MPQDDHPISLPKTSPFLLGFFQRHFRALLRKSYGTLWIERGSLRRIEGIKGGAIIFMNHASWWDAVTSLVLSKELFPTSRHYGPIDAEAIERYGFMKKIGFFGVSKDSRRGLRDFVRIGTAVSSSNDAMLWVTPQGKFADCRKRPVQFEPGIGHLAKRSVEGVLVPLSVEYISGDERWPDIFCRLGVPMRIPEHPDLDAAGWTIKLQHALENCQDELAAKTIERDLSPFVALIDGRRGTGGAYGWWQKLRAKLRGENFDPRHASIDETKELRETPPS